MLADAVCSDKRLERFRHTRRELEHGQGVAVSARCIALETACVSPRRDLFDPPRHPRSRSPGRAADGNPTRDLAGVWPGGSHPWHEAGGSLHPP
jgi:hypothetical protein